MKSISRRQWVRGSLAAMAGFAAVHEQFALSLAQTSQSSAEALVAGLRSGLRSEYGLADDVIYLNHASIGTIPRSVMRARSRYLEICEQNPWLYMWGGWEEAREGVRGKAARLLGCEVDEVSIQHNTTEGFNLLAAGLPLGAGDEVFFGSLNHPGASIAWHYYAQRRGYSVRTAEFPTPRTDQLSKDDVLGWYERQIRPETRVLVLPHVDNVVGIRHPLKELSKLAHDRGVEFVAVDGAQSVGMIPLNLKDSGVDYYASSPHKWIQAPKGLGLFYARQDKQEALKPLCVTWGQSRWEGTARIYEDYGTRNLAETLTLGDAIDFQVTLGDGLKTQRYLDLWKMFQAGVDASSRLRWKSPRDWSLGGSLFAIEIDGIKSPEAFEKMREQAGIIFRPFTNHGLNTVRISPNLVNSDADVERFFELARTV